jgi:hypothetical protein
MHPYFYSYYKKRIKISSAPLKIEINSVDSSGFATKKRGVVIRSILS